MKRKPHFPMIALLSVALSSGALLAQEHQHEQHKEKSQTGHSHAQAEIHGGEAAMTQAHHFEVVWMPDHVMVYLYDIDQKPLAAKGVTGEVVFKFKDGKEQKAPLALMAAGKKPMMGEHHTESGQHEMMHGKMSKEQMEAMHKLMSNQDHFMASVNLENLKEGDVKATFTFKGLPGEGEREATFTAKYKKMGMKREAGKHEQHH